MSDADLVRRPAPGVVRLLHGDRTVDVAPTVLTDVRDGVQPPAALTKLLANLGLPASPTGGIRDANETG